MGLEKSWLEVCKYFTSINQNCQIEIIGMFYFDDFNVELLANRRLQLQSGGEAVRVGFAVGRDEHGAFVGGIGIHSDFCVYKLNKNHEGEKFTC